MHLDDFLTESFLSRIKDKQENGADFRIFAFSQKKEREKGQKRRKKRIKKRSL